MRHGKGSILGVLRRALTHSARSGLLRISRGKVYRQQTDSTTPPVDRRRNEQRAIQPSPSAQLLKNKRFPSKLLRKLAAEKKSRSLLRENLRVFHFLSR